MKIKIGFVTNSSSTSYLILMKKEDYEEAANAVLTTDEKQNYYFYDTTIFGVKAKIMLMTDYDYGDILEEDEVFKKLKEYLGDRFYHYEA